MSRCRTCALTAIASRLRTAFARCPSGHAEKQCNWWCAACGGQHDSRAPNRVLLLHDTVDPREAKVFRAHAAAKRNVRQVDQPLKLLTTQQKDGDSPVENTPYGTMDGLRKFIAVDNHEPVNAGRLRRDIKSFKVVKPKFTTDLPGAVIRQGAGELTMRAHEEGARRIDTSK